jgi:Mrp family chromosome partitioning ATPase
LVPRDGAECIGTQAPVEHAIRRDAATGVFLLAASEVNARPLRILASARLHSLLELWRTQFDAILIDSPPILVAGDARVLAQASDYAIVVTRWGSTSWTALGHALRALSESGARVAGIAVSRADVRRLASHDYAEAQFYGPAYRSRRQDRRH